MLPIGSLCPGCEAKMIRKDSLTSGLCATCRYEIGTQGAYNPFDKQEYEAEGRMVYNRSRAEFEPVLI